MSYNTQRYLASHVYYHAPKFSFTVNNYGGCNHGKCGGTIWSGLGMGFGLGLGNLAGGLFGYGMNWLFGGIGGFGGGCSWFNNMTSWLPWGSSYVSGSSSCDCCSGHKDSLRSTRRRSRSSNNDNKPVVNEEKVDPDRAKLHELHAELNNMKKPTAEELDAFITKVKAEQEKQDKNDVHDTQDNIDFADLIATAEKWKTLAVNAEKSKGDDKKVAKIAVKYFAAPDALDTDTSITPEQKAAAQKLICEAYGYTDYDGTAKVDNVVAAIDILGKKFGTARDIIQKDGLSAEITTDKGSNIPQTIKITDKDNNKVVTYKLENGRYISQNSPKDNPQEYRLQKGSDGKYYLVQYNWHKGTGISDIRKTDIGV